MTNWDVVEILNFLLAVLGATAIIGVAFSVVWLAWKRFGADNMSEHNNHD